MRNSIVVITLVFLFVVSCQNQVHQNTESQKPNILFLLADYLGYGELGCYGQETIITIKQKTSVRFNSLGIVIEVKLF